VRALALSIAFLVMLLCGCAPDPRTPVRDTKASDLDGSTWTLDQVATGARGIPVHGTGELVFAVDGTLRGNAGCHRFTASYTSGSDGSSGVAVTLADLDIAHMNCEALYGEQETAVFDALGQGFEARVIGDSLVIERDGSSSSLGFVEKRADTAPGTLTPR
jgi:heat shock protein HslJ